MPVQCSQVWQMLFLMQQHLLTGRKLTDNSHWLLYTCAMQLRYLTNTLTQYKSTHYCIYFFDVNITYNIIKRLFGADQQLTCVNYLGVKDIKNIVAFQGVSILIIQKGECLAKMKILKAPFVGELHSVCLLLSWYQCERTIVPAVAIIALWRIRF